MIITKRVEIDVDAISILREAKLLELQCELTRRSIIPTPTIIDRLRAAFDQRDTDAFELALIDLISPVRAANRASRVAGEYHDWRARRDAGEAAHA